MGIIDLHMHLLHGLDDGPQTLEESLRMCEISHRDGIRTLVATPHTLNGIYQNNRSTVLTRVREFKEALGRSEIPGLKSEMEILPGADVHLNQEMISQLDQGKITTLGDIGKSLLIEFPSQNIPYGSEEVLQELLQRGILPVITHPERNLDLLQRPQRYCEMIRMGCVGQVTAMSVTGGFGPDVRRFVEKLLKYGLLHVIASDAHSTSGRSPILTPAVEAAEKIVGEEEAWRMVTDYPKDVLEGRRPYGRQ